MRLLCVISYIRYIYITCAIGSLSWCNANFYFAAAKIPQSPWFGSIRSRMLYFWTNDNTKFALFFLVSFRVWCSRINAVKRFRDMLSTWRSVYTNRCLPRVFSVSTLTRTASPKGWTAEQALHHKISRTCTSFLFPRRCSDNSSLNV